MRLICRIPSEVDVGIQKKEKRVVCLKERYQSGNDGSIDTS